MSQKVIIQAHSLNAGYVNSHILFDIDFEAKQKEITIIVGPNGSGKSTVLKTIFGLCKVYSGKIIFHDDDITGMSTHQVARRKIAYLPQINNVFANLSIKENLLMAGYTLDSDTFSQRITQIFETFPILRKFEKSKSNILSGGQRQMLGMAMALIRRPEVMLFDEPTASLSPKLAQDVLDKIKQMRDDFGITIILVEQNLTRALEMGDRVYLFANGKNVFAGKPSELIKHPDLSKLYLGIN